MVWFLMRFNRCGIYGYKGGIADEFYGTGILVFGTEKEADAVYAGAFAFDVSECFDRDFF